MPKIDRTLPSLTSAALVLVPGTQAWASEPPCPSGEQALSCRLHGLLRLLSATAVVLGVLLALALMAAVWYYRRNRNKELLPR